MRNFICDPTAVKVENEIVDFSAEVDYDAGTKD
jgi:hypothetical protein